MSKQNSLRSSMILACFFLLLLGRAEAAHPSDIAATTQLLAFVNTGTLGTCVATAPCVCTGITCEDGRVVSISLAVTLTAAQQFPDLSGYTQLRSLSFVSGTQFFPGDDISRIALLGTLEEVGFFGNPVTPVNFGGLGLPAGIGAGWPRLRIFTMFFVTNLALVPNSIDLWSNLKQMQFETVNTFVSSIPLSIPILLTGLTSLEFFSVGNLNISPPQRVPRLGAKANLTYYDVFEVPGFNLFSDPFLFDSPNLLDFNIFSLTNTVGTFPENIGNATRLRFFNMFQTPFVGNVPAGVRRLKVLGTMIVNGVPLSGTLPPEIGECTSLTRLILSSVRLGGTIPTEVGKLTALTRLILTGDITGSRFIGKLPSQAVELVFKNLTNLQISSTFLSGEIPESSILPPPPSSLTRLVLSDNRFQCALPTWLVQIVPSLSAPNCRLQNNDFCLFASPLSPADVLKCGYTLTHIPCLCDECPGERLPSCLDCAGVAGGSSQYDACDICGGNSQSCIDCLGTPNGAAFYDLCDECGLGQNRCLDCDAVPFGTKLYDVCDVCNGNGLSCRDCRGVPNGSALYDVCDVCGGDGLTCRDCAGTVGGLAEYDACGVCADLTSPSYAPACYDCNGTAFGTATRDLCGVCGGTNVDCEPDEIGAGVAGLRIVVPWLIAFGSIDLILAIAYFAFVRTRKPASERREEPTTRAFGCRSSDFESSMPPPPTPRLPKMQ